MLLPRRHSIARVSLASIPPVAHCYLEADSATCFWYEGEREDTRVSGDFGSDGGRFVGLCGEEWGTGGKGGKGARMTPRPRGKSLAASALRVTKMHKQ